MIVPLKEHETVKQFVATYARPVNFLGETVDIDVRDKRVLGANELPNPGKLGRRPLCSRAIDADVIDKNRLGIVSSSNGISWANCADLLSQREHL